MGKITKIYTKLKYLLGKVTSLVSGIPRSRGSFHSRDIAPRLSLGSMKPLR